MRQNQPTNGETGSIRSMRNWVGKRIEPFTNRTLFSLSKHNECLAAINAFLNARVARGSTIQIVIDDSGWTITGSGTGGGGGTGSGVTQITSNDHSIVISPADGLGPVVDLSSGSGGIAPYTFESFGFGGNNSYITCAGGIQVRLPPLLRFTVGSRNPYGVLITYDQYNAGQQSRRASSGGFSVTQYITPQYLPGDTLYAASTGGILQDLNVDGRTFAGP